MNKTLLIIGGKLALICAAAALILALVSAVTSPVIEENRIRALNEALARVAGGGVIGERVPAEDTPGVRAHYPVFATEEMDELRGYVVDVIGTGYGGEMSMLAAVEPDGVIISAELMDNAETPGLGKKAETEEYMQMFAGTGTQRPVPLSRDQLEGPDADAVTGATITFLGVARALETASDYVKEVGSP